MLSTQRDMRIAILVFSTDCDVEKHSVVVNETPDHCQRTPRRILGIEARGLRNVHGVVLRDRRRPWEFGQTVSIDRSELECGRRTGRGKASDTRLHASHTHQPQEARIQAAV